MTRTFKTYPNGADAENAGWVPVRQIARTIAEFVDPRTGNMQRRIALHVQDVTRSPASSGETFQLVVREVFSQESGCNWTTIQTGALSTDIHFTDDVNVAGGRGFCVAPRFHKLNINEILSRPAIRNLLREAKQNAAEVHMARAARYENVSDHELRSWLIAGRQRPVPAAVRHAKEASGLSWNAFIQREVAV